MFLMKLIDSELCIDFILFCLILQVKAELSYEHPYEDMLDFNVANPKGETCATRLDEWYM